MKLELGQDYSSYEVRTTSFAHWSCLLVFVNACDEYLVEVLSWSSYVLHSVLHHLSPVQMRLGIDRTNDTSDFGVRRMKFRKGEVTEWSKCVLLAAGDRSRYGQ